MAKMDVRHRRLFVPLRWAAKQALVQWDVLQCRRDPELRKWLPALLGARAGHVVIPSRAIAASRAEAASFVAEGVVKAGDRVLDVGAGNGRQAIGLLEHGISQYAGLEVIRASVDHANGAFRGLGPVRFDWLDVANPMYNPGGRTLPENVVFPYADGSFDFVVAGSLYTHLERLDVAARYVAETARVLRAGGGAYMSWFKSPPNTPTASAIRTVFPSDHVLEVVQGHFDVVTSAGGETTGWHDQWRLFLRKR